MANINATDLEYQAINGNEKVYRVILRKEIIGYVHLNEKTGKWIYQPLNKREYTTGETRTIAVGKSLLKN